MIDEKIIKNEYNERIFILRTNKFDYLFYEKIFIAKRDIESNEYWYTLAGKKHYKRFVDSTFSKY